MRPLGEISRAMLAAAERMVCMRAQQPLRAVNGQWIAAATWRELAADAQVGAVAARRTVENMARSGALERRGLVSVPGSRRPMVAYAPPARGFVLGGEALQGVLHDWQKR